MYIYIIYIHTYIYVYMYMYSISVSTTGIYLIISCNRRIKNYIADCFHKYVNKIVLFH